MAAGKTDPHLFHAPAMIDLPASASRAAALWEGLHRASGRRVVVAAVCSIALIGIVSVAAPRGLELEMLVVVPLAIVAAVCGVVIGAALAVFAAAALAVLDLRYGDVPAIVGLANLGLRLLGLVAVVLVVQTMLELLRYAAVLSWTDDLTGLPNRRAWCSRAELELARMRRTGTPLTVAYLDIDGFKAINDRFGHGVGDQTLRRMAALLHGRLRETDMSARLGGDEFAVLLPDTSDEDAVSFLRSLKEAFAEVQGDAVPFTVSVGAATFSEPPGSASTLLSLSDELMYEAKHRGRGEREGPSIPASPEPRQGGD